jgi:hypothetical protein
MFINLWRKTGFKGKTKRDQEKVVQLHRQGQFYVKFTFDLSLLFLIIWQSSQQKKYHPLFL